MANTLEVILKLKDDFTKGLNKAEGNFKRFSKQLHTDIKSIATIPNIIAGTGVAWISKSLYDAATELQGLQMKMNAAIPTFEGGRKEFEWINEQSDRMGLNFKKTADEYSSFAAAALRTNIPLKETRKIFTDISETSVSMRLSNEKNERVLQALTQIASKGKVQMEELRGQLGDALPGAVAIAAKAMNMTSSAFQDAVKNGEVMANDFLPKFATQIRKELGGSFDSASNLIVANVNRLQNTWFQLKANFGQIFLGDASTGAVELNKILKGLLDNFGYIRAAVQILITPITILWNGFQILGTTIAAAGMQLWQVGKMVVYPFITCGNVLIETVSAIGKAFNALANRDFKELMSLGGGYVDKLKYEAQALWNGWTGSYDEIMALGNAWALDTNKQIEDIANQIGKTLIAFEKIDEKAKFVAGGIPGSGSGSNIAGTDGGNEKEQNRLGKQLHDMATEWAYADAKARFEAKKLYADQIIESEKMLQETQVSLMTDGAAKELALLDLKYSEIRDKHKNNADALANIDKAYGLEKSRIEKEQAKDGLNLIANNLNQMAGQWRGFMGSYKAFAYAQAAIDTYTAANAAYKAMAGIPYVGPVLGAAAAASTIGLGLANVAKIKAQKFAEGGSFLTNGPMLMLVGDNRGARERVSITPESSPNINGPTNSNSAVFNFYDQSGSLVESFRRDIRSGLADEVVRDIVSRYGAIS